MTTPKEPVTEVAIVEDNAALGNGLRKIVESAPDSSLSSGPLTRSLRMVSALFGLIAPDGLNQGGGSLLSQVSQP